MNYAEIFKCDFINGKGIRVSLFVSGCPHRCEGCYNEKAWEKSYGKPYTPEIENEIISILSEDSYAGLSLLGGEPLLYIKELIPLLKKVKAIGKNIWCWSGFTFEEIKNMDLGTEFLSYIDILVDGKFILEKKNLKLKFKGSENQRIINIKDSLCKNTVICVDF